jgi:LmbE family N-acetylglucosaminyl deacetylase
MAVPEAGGFGGKLAACSTAGAGKLAACTTAGESETNLDKPTSDVKEYAGHGE